MTGLVPVIHVVSAKSRRTESAELPGGRFFAAAATAVARGCLDNVDARDKPGQDEIVTT